VDYAAQPLMQSLILDIDRGLRHAIDHFRRLGSPDDLGAPPGKQLVSKLGDAAAVG
jgi:hypothetical protein